MSAGQLEIHGAARIRADRAEARVTGNSFSGISLEGHWVGLKLDKASGNFDASLTEQFTVVVPFGKVEPLGNPLV